jgi:hypothetical protein
LQGGGGGRKAWWSGSTRGSRAPEPENTVLAGDTRAVRWASPLFALLALIMVPWLSLHSQELTKHRAADAPPRPAC